MNKFYIILPLVACLVFGGFYLKSDKDFRAEQEIKKAAAQTALKEKQRHDAEMRQSAYQAAIDSQAQRKKEREERERIDEEKKRVRADLEDKRQRAFDERRRLRDQVERARKEVAGVEKEIATIEPAKKAHQDELNFLRDYVKTAKTNVNSYYQLLEKIAAAEKTAAQAASQAAAAAAKK